MWGLTPREKARLCLYIQSPKPVDKAHCVGDEEGTPCSSISFSWCVTTFQEKLLYLEFSVVLFLHKLCKVLGMKGSSLIYENNGPPYSPLSLYCPSLANHAYTHILIFCHHDSWVIWTWPQGLQFGVSKQLSLSWKLQAMKVLKWDYCSLLFYGGYRLRVQFWDCVTLFSG